MRLPFPFSHATVRVAMFVLALLAIPLVGSFASDEFRWSVFDFVLAGTLLAAVGCCLDAAARRRGSVVTAFVVAGFGTAAAVLGERDDAPGLVLVGAMAIAGAVALASRRHQRAG